MTDTIGDRGRITSGQGRDIKGYPAVNIVIYYYTTLIWAVWGGILWQCPAVDRGAIDTHFPI